LSAPFTTLVFSPHHHRFQVTKFVSPASITFRPDLFFSKVARHPGTLTYFWSSHPPPPPRPSPFGSRLCSLPGQAEKFPMPPKPLRPTPLNWKTIDEVRLCRQFFFFFFLRHLASGRKTKHVPPLACRKLFPLRFLHLQAAACTFPLGPGFASPSSLGLLPFPVRG